MSIKVTFEDLEASAKSLRSGQKDAESVLTKLKSEIDALVRNGFVTEKASGAFEETYTSYNKGATETIQALEGLATFLEKSAQSLRSTDEELAKALK